MNLLDNAGDAMDSMLPASSNTAAHVETFQSLTLWQEAQNQLGAGKLVVFHSQLSNRRELLVDILAIVRGAEQASLEKRWKWKNHKGEVVILRDVFGKMVVWIEKLKSIGDIIIQYDPIHSALPWAAARFVLQAVVNDAQAHGAMLEGLEYIFNLIARYEFIEYVYLQKISIAQSSLRAAILQVYTAILEYLLKTHQYFSQRTVTRIAKSVLQLEDESSKHLAIIKSKEERVQEYIKIISGDVLSQSSASLEHIKANFAKIRLSMESVISRAKAQDTTFDELRDELNTIARSFQEPVSRFAVQLSAFQDKLEIKERVEIFRWLSEVQYWSHHRAKVKDLLPKSGEWLLNHQTFVGWLGSSTSSILWLHGIPGSGKSMLVAKVIEYLIARNQVEDMSPSLGFFYCAQDTNEPERSDPEEALRSILEQLSSINEEISVRKPVVSAYLMKKREARGRKLEQLDLDETIKVILSLLKDNPALIIIDGLDECDPRRRQALLDGLETIMRKSDNIVKVFLSSRDDHDLAHRLTKTPNLYIHASSNEEDIRRFVIFRVGEAIRKQRLLCGNVSKQLRQEIIDILIQKAEGMFRLASLHIEHLCDPSRVKTRENALNALGTLPRNLTNSYDGIMSQIAKSEEPNPMLASRVFRWLLCARTSLPAETFTLAVSFDTSVVLTKADLLSICCNLVIYDEFSDKYRFAHLSVKEYLEILHPYSAAECNAFAAQQCLSWICHTPQDSQYDEGKFAGSQALRSKLLFTKHADLYWPEYAMHSANQRAMGELRRLLKTFMIGPEPASPTPDDAFSRWVSRLRHNAMHKTSHLKTTAPLLTKLLYCYEDPLSVACQFHLTEIVTALLQQKNSVHAFTLKNSSGLNCAQVAACYDGDQVIHILLEESKKFHLPSEYWNIALFYAAAQFKIRSSYAILGGTEHPLLNFNDNEIKEFVLLVVEYMDHQHLIRCLLDGSSVFEQGAFDHLAKQLSSWGRTRDCVTASRSIKRSNRKNNIRLIERLVHDLQPVWKMIFLAKYLHQIMSGLRPNTSLSWTKDELENNTRNVLEAVIGQDGLHPSARYFLLGLYGWANQITGSDAEILLLDLLERGAAIDFQLDWKDLFNTYDLPSGKSCINLLLQLQPAITPSAVQMILSWHSDVTVRHLLAFHQVDITSKVIETVAGNYKNSQKIMELLLNQEFSSEGDNNDHKEKDTSALSIQFYLAYSVDFSDFKQQYIRRYRRRPERIQKPKLTS